jgi:hypothetical protein
MLDYVDDESRKGMIKLIYDNYKIETKKSCLYGVPDFEIINHWEDYRHKWLMDNINNPLKKIQNG